MNDVAFDPVDGDLLASVSDDLTCRLWKAEDAKQVAIFPLAAPGMRVQWNHQDPLKVSKKIFLFIKYFQFICTSFYPMLFLIACVDSGSR